MDPKNEKRTLARAQKAYRRGEFYSAIDLAMAIPSSSALYGYACKVLGGAYLRQGKLNKALESLQKAHPLLPKDPDILVDGADVARQLGDLDGAESIYSEARALGAESYQLRFGEASLLILKKQWLKAAAALENLLEERPGDAAALHNCGKAWHELGETDLAMDYWFRALELGVTHQTLVALATTAPHAPSIKPNDIKEIRSRLGRFLKKTSVSFRQGASKAIPASRRIRIGYVSAFFHRKNWMKPVWALLNNHDRTAFEVHLFADGPPDEISGGYEHAAVDRIHDTRQLDNPALAALIDKEDIDVIVDLNSYSAPNRLALWVEHPARVSLAWFNLYATSGLPGIECLVGDDVVVKDGEERYYTEKIVRLPQSYLTFSIGYDTPEIDYPQENGTFTYGCLGSGYKLTPQVRNSWIDLLKRTNETRLVVRNRVLDSADHRDWFRSFFTSAGIDSDRLVLLGGAPHREFLGTYGMIDLALDTFPYNGGTTTMEALWQGVPVVCIDGDRWVSRTSATLMNSAGLQQFIAKNTDEYIEIAARFSEKRSAMQRIRKTMRRDLKSSSVLDGKGLALAFERLVREEIDAKRARPDD